MKVWDLVNCDAFKKASNDTPILYCDGSLGYVNLKGYIQDVNTLKTILASEGESNLTKDVLMSEPLLILNFLLMIDAGKFTFNTNGCVVVLEDCGIVIKERDLV